MKKQCAFFILLLSGILPNSLQAAVPKWVQFNNVERLPDGFKALGADPWLISERFAMPVTAEKSYMLIELSASRADSAQIYWQKEGQNVFRNTVLTNFEWRAKAKTRKNL